jgi:hypothetical protein
MDNGLPSGPITRFAPLDVVWISVLVMIRHRSFRSNK